MKNYPAIGIRPIVDSRRMGIRDALEGKVREMAESAKKLRKCILCRRNTCKRCDISGQYRRRRGSCQMCLLL